MESTKGLVGRRICGCVKFIVGALIIITAALGLESGVVDIISFLIGVVSFTVGRELRIIYLKMSSLIRRAMQLM